MSGGVYTWYTYPVYPSLELICMSVRHALLALLREGPKYGLQLRHEFEERTGDVWPLNVGQVYTTLQRLERDGLIESDGNDGTPEAGPQKSFRLTPSGGTELDSWLRTPPDLSSPPRDELVIKVLVASRRPWRRRARRDPEPPASRRRTHAAMDQGEARCPIRRGECGARRRRGALPAGLGDPVARCGGRPAAPRG